MRDDLADLCRTLAPDDLGDTPVYVVPGVEVPPQIGGYTGPLLDLEMRPAIGKAWRGRGVCMVVNTDPFWAIREVDVAMHELAHVLTRPANFAPEPAAGFAPDLALATPETLRVAAADALDVGDHGPEFLRAALHLAARADRLRVAFDAGRVCACYARRRWSGFRAYRHALGDELTRGGSIRAALATDPPPAFLGLYERDCRG